MKTTLLTSLTCALLCCACGGSLPSSVTLSATRESDSLSGQTDDSLKQEDTDYATYYIVIADTGRGYSKLHNQMTQLSQIRHWPIDTMGRTYNAAKDLIALPENDEDEIYAGEYFPRRFPSAELSLEYLNAYTDAGNKTIALVAGIFEQQSSADSTLKVLRGIAPGAFTLKATIYTGCMH